MNKPQVSKLLKPSDSLKKMSGKILKTDTPYCQIEGTILEIGDA